MDLNYDDFIKTKAMVVESTGINIDKEELNSHMFEYQKDIVRWALAKGKAAIFADCGIGKTICQLEWANQIIKHTDGTALILAPLAVVPQTEREGLKFGIDNVNICAEQSDVKKGYINITNYDKLPKFDISTFNCVVLDESSILKSFTGKIRNYIIDEFCDIDYKLACTATPAPNDYMELGNHSQFLGVMTREEMLAMFFVHDGGSTSKWRLKGHCDNMFWEWLCTWAVYINNPCDLGYNIEGFNLPNLNIHEIIVDGDNYITEVMTLTQRRQARKDTLDLRCQRAADLVNNSNEQWLVWCNLNDESKKLHELINESVEICGSDKDEHRLDRMFGFIDGRYKSLVTKPLIAGWGMNIQSCHNMIFVGLSDSYEQYYQAVRRCWRFGQTKEVNVYIIISAREGAVKENINKKESDFVHMKEIMSQYTSEITKKNLTKTCRISTPYEPNSKMVLPSFI